jgi:hypothetical protein
MATTDPPRGDKMLLQARRKNGEGRNRTGDTAIFSRMLYQLSYLAAAFASYRRNGERLAMGLPAFEVPLGPA